MRILGLDLSLRSTGYVLLDEDQVVWHGTVGSEHLREAERLNVFDQWIRQALDSGPPARIGKQAAVGFLGTSSFDAPVRVDHVAIEGYAYNMRQDETRAFAAGELGGIIKLAIHQSGIPLHIIASNTWKKVVCGNGRFDKRRASVEISKRYGVEFAKEDTLDAWAVAMCLRRQLLDLDKPASKAKKPKAAPLFEARA